MSVTRVIGETASRRLTTDEQVIILAGVQGPPGVSHGFVWRGIWNSGTPYAKDDGVVYGPNAWIALVANANVTPVEGATWTKLVDVDLAVSVHDVDPAAHQDIRDEALDDLADHVADADPHAQYLLASELGAVDVVTTQDAAFLLSTEDVLAVDASPNGPCVITLPPSMQGERYIVKKTDSSSKKVTIKADGAELIDGFNEQDLLLQSESLTMVGDGTGWLIV